MAYYKRVSGEGSNTQRFINYFVHIRFIIIFLKLQTNNTILIVCRLKAYSK